MSSVPFAIGLRVACPALDVQQSQRGARWVISYHSTNGLPTAYKQNHGNAVIFSCSCSGRGQRQTTKPCFAPFDFSSRNVSRCRASLRAGFSVHFTSIGVNWLPLWVAETSSGNEVVDSAGFVPKLISHVGDCLGALALPVFLAPSQTRTGLGEFGPPAPDRGAQPTGAQAQTAGQRSASSPAPGDCLRRRQHLVE